MAACQARHLISPPRASDITVPLQWKLVQKRTSQATAEALLLVLKLLALLLFVALSALRFLRSVVHESFPSPAQEALEAFPTPKSPVPVSPAPLYESSSFAAPLPSPKSFIKPSIQPSVKPSVPSPPPSPPAPLQFVLPPACSLYTPPLSAPSSAPLQSSLLPTAVR
jgi:hypothetical protein